MVDRVTVTPAAAAVIARLVASHGPLMFHQSGGCCDGSSPMCYPLGDFRVDAQVQTLRAAGPPARGDAAAPHVPA